MTRDSAVAQEAAGAAIRAAGPGVVPFDVHLHTGEDLDGTAHSAAEVVVALERFGGRGAIFPLAVAGGYAEENARVVREAAGAPDRLVAFARIDPRDRPAELAIAALGAGAVGLKLHPRAERFGLAHPGVAAVFEVANEAAVPVVIHAGRGVGRLGADLLDLAVSYRRVSLVLAHAAISDLAWLWREVPNHPNLFFDAAWWNPVDLLALFAFVPPGRILHGSDAPYGGVALNLTVTLRCARASGLSAEVIGLVAGGQLERLLAGEPPVPAGPAPRMPASRDTEMPLRRIATYLAAAGGSLMSGGDPSAALELARLAIDQSAYRSHPEHHDAIAELIEPSAAAGVELRDRIVLALLFALTPGVEVASPVAVAS